MSAYIATARRAAIAAVLLIAAACSSDEASAPAGTPGDTPPVQQPSDTSVTPAPSVASIQLSGDQEVVHTYGGWLQAKPVDAAGQPVAATVVWSTSDASIVSIDAGGGMIGKQPGKAVITARANGKSAQVEVTVAPRRVTTFQPTNAPAVLQRSEVGYFGTIPLDQHGQLIREPQIAYTSADPSIVQVNERGHLIAIRGGEARVTATADGVSTSHVVKVANATTWPIRYANGNALPWVAFEATTQEGAVRVTTRLVMTEASFTLSNVSDTWSQRTVVEEYRIEESDGVRIVRKIGTDVSTSAGSFTLDPISGHLYLSTNGSSEAPLQAWYADGNVRRLRVMKPYGRDGDNGFLNDYER